MSGPAPSNPGAPKVNSKAPNVSAFAKHPGRFVAGGILAAVTIGYFMYPPAPSDEPVVNFRTTGVQNIEKAYTNAGATPTHTKAYGGTKQGDKESTAMREGDGQSGSGHKELNPFTKEGMGDDQKPWITSKAGEAFDQTNLGSKKGEACDVDALMRL